MESSGGARGGGIPGPYIPSEPEHTELKRVITRPMLTFFVLGDILGAGIYSLTGKVAADVGGAVWASFLVSFLLAFMTAFAYVELVTKYPQAAGAALYVNKAFRNQTLTFLVTLAVMMSGVTSAATSARAVGGDYFSGLVGAEQPPTTLIGIAFILLVALVNYRGIAESVKINVGISLIELTGLLFIIAVGLWVLLSGDGTPGQAFRFEGEGFGVVTGVLAGAATAFYAFIGFEDSVNLAEETREPHRAFPPALFTGLIAASIIYLLVAFTVVMVVPLDVLTESTGPLLEVVREAGLNVGQLFSLIGMIAVANTALINMVMASRLLYGIARQGVLPVQFTRVSPTRRTPTVAIAFTTLVAMVLIATADDLTDLSDTTVLLLTAAFLLVNISVLVLRRDPVDHDHFHAPTVIPVIGAVVSVVFLLPPQQEGPTYVRALIVMAVGVVLWVINLLYTRRQRTPTGTGGR